LLGASNQGRLSSGSSTHTDSARLPRGGIAVASARRRRFCRNLKRGIRKIDRSIRSLKRAKALATCSETVAVLREGIADLREVRQELKDLRRRKCCPRCI